MQFMDIVFKFGEFYGEAASAWEVKDLVNAVIGGLISLVIAYAVYYFESKRDRNKDEAAAKELQRERFEFFKFQLKLVDEATQKQAGFFEDMAAKLREDPVNQVHGLQISYELDALQSLFYSSSADAYHSYLFFNSTGGTSFESFKKIFRQVIYFSSTYQQIKEDQKRYRDLTYSRQMEFKNRTQNLADLITDTLSKIKYAHKPMHPTLPEYQVLDRQLNEYHNLLKRGASLLEIKTLFLDAFINDLLVNYPDDEQRHSLLINTARIRVLFNDMYMETRNYAGICDSRAAELKKALESYRSTVGSLIK
jgi:hypothetical protein